MLLFLDDAASYCSDLAFAIRIVKYLVGIIKFAVPILLIVFVTIDFTKAVIGKDEKAAQEAKNKAVKRIIYAIILFLVPTIVSLIFKNIVKVQYTGLTSPDSFVSCYFNS